MVGTHVIRLGMLSNVAAVAMLAPVVFAMAPKLGLHPVAFTMLVCDTDTFAYILPTQITAAVIGLRHGHLHSRRLRQGGLRFGMHRHRLRPVHHGPLVRPLGHARLGSGRTLGRFRAFSGLKRGAFQTENALSCAIKRRSGYGTKRKLWVTSKLICWNMFKASRLRTGPDKERTMAYIAAGRASDRFPETPPTLKPSSSTPTC